MYSVRNKAHTELGQSGVVLTKAEEELVSVALLAALLPAELMLLRAELRLPEAELAAPDRELLRLDPEALASLPVEEALPEALPEAPPAKMVVASEVVMVEPSVVRVVRKDEVVTAEPESVDCN